jgi:uncharacterized membrane protein YphA (DoxX/SURF4 family)
MFALMFPGIAMLGFLVQAGLTRQPRTAAHLLDLLLRWSFGAALGASSLFGFFGHTFQAQQVAEQIGFPPGNPFQWEVAWANLALGALAIIAIWRRDFWWPTAIAAAIFGWGAAWGHIYQLVVHNNHATYNSGPILYTDILVPAAILLMLLAGLRLARPSRSQEPTAASGQPVGQRG